MAINLLPPKFKQEKKVRKAMKTIYALLAIAFAILIILSLIIWISNYTLKKDLKKINQTISEQNTALVSYKETEESVKKLNSKLGSIQIANASRILWSNVIIELSKCTPTQVQIQSLTLDQQNKKITLTGYAETRSDIAKLKEKMSSSKYFKSVTFSSSAHNQEQGNFSFNLTAEIGETR